MTIYESPTHFDGEFDWDAPIAEHGPGGTATATSALVVMTVRGTRQGPFRGDKQGDERISATLVSYSLMSPRDAATGRATGRRRHAPIVVRQALAPSTVQFFQALTTNENLQAVTIDVGATLRISLADANVQGVRVLGENGASGAEVAFGFRKIQLAHVATGMIAVDDWVASV